MRRMFVIFRGCCGICLSFFVVDAASVQIQGTEYVPGLGIDWVMLREF